ncbi:cell division protein FtsQ/DivIB [Actinomadura parmotrematis]|uniref:FtsQ-type POTRA domain-containing protein n=1 Tax=Actinomadura parmotrematis TaxID=2864039 RepID=A0ABS7FKY6_9ACTN|nr:FtsQ-type POTRA domain-containing protein [Actinomadura parmotrematis]MBW8481022.1 FtsQ-type POTRA domain-containing protein [Actinomadura parmotrematis]
MTEAGIDRRSGTAARRERGAGSPPGRRGGGRWRALFVLLLAAAVLGAASWALLGSRLLVVRHVRVVGAHLAPQDRIAAAAGIRLGVPMVRLDTGAVRDRVRKVREVRGVEVERAWPDTVRIVVRERVPVVAVQRGGRYYRLDAEGVTVADGAAPPAGLPLLTATAPGPGDPGTLAALKVVGDLPDGLRRRLAEVTVPSPESVTLRLKSGLTVVWGAPERTAEKARLVDGLEHTTAGRGARTIDVSSPDVVTTS